MTPSRAQTIVRVATITLLAVDLLWLVQIARGPHHVEIDAHVLARLSRDARWVEVPASAFNIRVSSSSWDEPHGSTPSTAHTSAMTLATLRWLRREFRGSHHLHGGRSEVSVWNVVPRVFGATRERLHCVVSHEEVMYVTPSPEFGRFDIARMGDATLFRCVRLDRRHHDTCGPSERRSAVGWTFGVRPDPRALIASWLTLLAFVAVSAFLLRSPRPPAVVAEVAPTAPGVAYREADSPSPTTPAADPVSPWWARPFTPAVALRRLAFAWAAVVLGALSVFARVP